MRYLGGKSKIRKQLAAFLEALRKPEQQYVEPFVGGGWVLQEISNPRQAGDGNAALVALYQAVQDGWEPPDFVSEETYAAYQAERPSGDPMTAFCDFGCSFGGKWFGGYARGSGRNFAAECRRNVLKQKPMLEGVAFHHRLFHEWAPTDSLVYCDPPYAGTTAYGAFEGFDHTLFWETLRGWAAAGNTVVVSEYQAPKDFVCVREFGSRMGLTAAGERPVRVERVFLHESQAGLDLC